VLQFVLAPNVTQFYVPRELVDFRIDNNRQFSGSFYIVKKFDSPDGSTTVMIHKFENPFDSISGVRLVYREIHYLRTLAHENIVKLQRTYKVDDEEIDSQSIYYITDYCGVYLREKIEEGRYSLECVKQWCTELLRAVAYLHSKGIIHGNLHPGNICIDDNGKLTISGFGNVHTSVIDPTTNEMGASECVSRYMPIEQLIDWEDEFDEKVDIWSIATILYELLTGSPLFD
ncbi:hypothetical protein PMAYCL1PPCAC_14146, partial [Pristionchus mayeri]